MSYRPDGHIDPDVLVLRAMGERVGTATDEVADTAHLDVCARCQVEFEQFRAIAATARSIDPNQPLVPPPPHVWEGVRSELGLVDRTVVPMRTRGRRSVAAVAVAAACAGMLVGGAVVHTASQRDTQIVTATQPTIIASAALAPLKSSSAHGTAQLMTDGKVRMVKVDVSDLAPSDGGFYQVWLLDSDAKKLVVLGALNASSAGTFVIPANVSVHDFPVVDVSLQEVNGNPNHSGNSLVRGTLPDV